MLLLLVLGASAQPGFYGNGPFNGAGTPGLYGGGSFGGGRPVAQNQDRWDLYQANRAIRASELDARGHSVIFNLPGTPFIQDTSLFGNSGLLRFGSYAKAAGAQLDEQRIQDEIDYYRRTHPRLTRDDQEVLDDLVLQRESARNQKLRRTLGALPFPGTIPATSGPIAAFFERRANENDLDLAQNAVVDARSDLRTDPSQDKFVQFRNARDDVEQADARRDANTLDLLGSTFGGIGSFAPVLRKKASQTKLDIGYRNLRLAQQEYAKEPTEINRMNVQLANLFIDATAQEDDGNKNDIVTSRIFGVSPQASIANLILSSKNFSDEANIWLRYDRLKRKILIRQQIADAQGKAGSGDENTVANQMLGMSMYGPPAGGNPRSGE